MNRSTSALSKVPEVTLLFWIIKIAATTLGETGGDLVSMSLNWGYLLSTLLFAVLFALMVVVQIKAKIFHPLIYWLTIIATTTVGTTLADFTDRSLGIGYMGGVLLLSSLLVLSLLTWYFTLGNIGVDSITTAKAECFYWLTILFSQTLGTALGDWTADSLAWGYEGAALFFSILLSIIALIYLGTKKYHVLLFWAAFILTRPLGAVVGDFLDKPLNQGGLALSRYSASALLFVFILLCIFLFKQKPAQTSH
ncbi:hypothetical protein [Legionella sp. km772]|uniref:COG4705 family protein n=1 Tax=Legionella sp. km772 TaxID=2498111 RepID=UPI000F8F4F43|nr:hypothetical protein [Legionella sp. km772]RUR05947.1 hypothetical protein ELY15_13675 [Legionella sp. km772]